MRQLSVLTLAIATAIYAFHRVAQGSPLATFVLRDGLLLAAVSALLFAFYATPPEATRADASLRPRQILPWLILVTLLAAGLRFANLIQLPPGCIDRECARALQLTEATSAPASLFDWLAPISHRLTGQPLFSLRVTSALLGVLTIPLLFLAARPLTSTGGALVATLLLALNPWHIWASRSAEPWISLPALLLLLWWLCTRLLTTPRLFNLRIFLPALVVLALLFYELRTLPWRADGETVRPLLAALWQTGGSSVTLLFAEQPLLPPLLAALTFLGIGYLLRYGWQMPYGLLLGGLLLISARLLRADLNEALASSWLLLGLPFFWLCMAVAAGQWTYLLQRTWRPLWRPASLLLTTLLFLLLYNGQATLAFWQQLGASNTAGQRTAQAAIGRALAQRLQENPDGPIVYFAPAALLAGPSAHLLFGAALERGQVRPLEKLAAALPTLDDAQELRLLIPSDDSQRLEMVHQLFPAGELHSQSDETSGDLLFVSFTVPSQQRTEQQGLLGVLFTDDGSQLVLPTPAALTFAWQEQPVWTTPFRAQWQGSLLVAQHGDYTFAVDGVVDEQVRFSLALDGVPLLDSTQGLIERTIKLAQGFYHLEMSYESNAASASRTTALPPLTVRWRTTESEWSAIPKAHLQQTTLVNRGMVGAYFAGSQWSGEWLDYRKELTIAPPPELTTPYSAQWLGRFAAVRAGEYGFSTLANGVNQVLVNGQMVVDSRPVEGEESSRAAGLLYLTQGWHNLEVRFAATQSLPIFHLLWQPPGGEASVLDTTYLAPFLPGQTVAQPPLPPPPPLFDPRLGDERFALTLAGGEEAQMRGSPPSNLPLLPFTPLWQVDRGCGADPSQFSQPQGVALGLGRGSLFVADTGNRRVLEYTLDGRSLGAVQSEQFQELYDIGVGIDGLPLVLDAVAQQAFAVDLDLGQVRSLPLASSFYRPRGFQVDAEGNLMVADTGGARVAVFRGDGQAAGQFGGPETPLGHGQPVDALFVNGVLWALTAEDGRLWRLDVNGSLTAIQPGNTLAGAKLASLPSGALWASDPARGLILYFAASGQPLAQFAAPEFLATPTGIDAALLDNDVYLTVVDSALCTLSLWRMPAAWLPA